MTALSTSLAVAGGVVGLGLILWPLGIWCASAPVQPRPPAKHPFQALPCMRM